MEGRERVYYSMGRSAEFDRQIMDWVNSIRGKEASGAAPPGEFTDLNHMVHDLRLFKSGGTAADAPGRRITARGHCRAMAVCRGGLYNISWGRK